MRRGEVWWAELPAPVRRRPVVLLSRDEAYQVRELVTVAPVTTRIRSIPSEVQLGKAEGLPKKCVVNLDTITTIPKRLLAERICLLPEGVIQNIENAIRFSLGMRGAE
ncbi:type II toxin-antitoxin system PemK/MazF family toxin [candidate division TA06 bacterium]|uniref:Type II toxin-antitoxin system PemK/MazF family toxin n=1 Tax=candidate division TA06 bacterium TaxID=2250710 RepID=A0A523XMK0_UNCT6|nr:MAG: type II toxin-antitoxin system PemK/MazF family toxin [candidate division TA06 bacterium]